MKNKQITVYELLPLLKPGFVAMNDLGEWWWFSAKPIIFKEKSWKPTGKVCKNLTAAIHKPWCFHKIKKFDGDWKDSLMEVK